MDDADLVGAVPAPEADNGPMGGDRESDRRSSSRRAAALDAALQRELKSAAGGTSPSGWPLLARTAAIVLLTVPVHLATPAALVGAAWVARDGAPPLSYFFAVALVLGAIGSWPGRASPVEPVATYGRRDAPATFRLLDRVCQEVGAPRLQRLDVTSGATAQVFRTPWRHRPALSVGALLWASLSDQGRVAVLAHEIAHLVRPELRLARLSDRAQTILEEWRQITGGQRSRRIGDENDGRRFLTTVTAVLLAPARWIAIVWSRSLQRLQAPVTARGEMRADRDAAAVAGTEAVFEAWDLSHGAATWETALSRGLSQRADLAVTLRSAAASVPAQRQADRRRVSAETGQRVDEAHPATGLRRELLSRTSVSPATVPLSVGSDVRSSDTELADGIAQALREAAHRVRYGTPGGDPGRQSAAAVRRQVEAQNEMNSF